jgi:hypothetical protein
MAHGCKPARTVPEISICLHSTRGDGLRPNHIQTVWCDAAGSESGDEAEQSDGRCRRAEGSSRTSQVPCCVALCRTPVCTARSAPPANFLQTLLIGVVRDVGQQKRKPVVKSVTFGAHGGRAARNANHSRQNQTKNSAEETRIRFKNKWQRTTHFSPCCMNPPCPAPPPRPSLK